MNILTETVSMKDVQMDSNGITSEIMDELSYAFPGCSDKVMSQSASFIRNTMLRTNAGFLMRSNVGIDDDDIIDAGSLIAQAYLESYAIGIDGSLDTSHVQDDEVTTSCDYMRPLLKAYSDAFPSYVFMYVSQNVDAIMSQSRDSDELPSWMLKDLARALFLGLTEGMADRSAGNVPVSKQDMCITNALVVTSVCNAIASRASANETSSMSLTDDDTNTTVTLDVPSDICGEHTSIDYSGGMIHIEFDPDEARMNAEEAEASIQENISIAMIVADDFYGTDTDMTGQGSVQDANKLRDDVMAVISCDDESSEPSDHTISQEFKDNVLMIRSVISHANTFCSRCVISPSGIYQDSDAQSMCDMIEEYIAGYIDGTSDYSNGSVNEHDDSIGVSEASDAICQWCSDVKYKPWICSASITKSISRANSSVSSAFDDDNASIDYGRGYADGVAQSAADSHGDEYVTSDEAFWL